ncbi:helicase [Pseudomonas sp. C27(2019)]|uniref:DEAD/DEAH box helicase n=1 Tax=Pseudomonas sp. C27(2019) TaxID=2604941 RepID=UPI001249182F|nr:DEAD/DEAH box helicase [Pseudomonas sp. C27(2019)]QEY59638.1 helicase [Pseudomonas sp. C27(2019)]
MSKTLNIDNLQCAQWRQAIQLGDFQRGKAYAAQNRSTVLNLQDSTLTAQCKGSAGQTYLQTITLLARDGHYDVNGRCSCYVSYNCKHVVAALLTLEQMQQQGQTPPRLPSAASKKQAAQSLQITDAPVSAPQPQLTFGSVILKRYDARSARMQTTVQHRAALAFNYQGHLCSGKPTADFLASTGPYQRLRITRDLGFESSCREQLKKLGWQLSMRRSDAVPESAGDAYELPSERAWLAFMQQPLQDLQAQGWHVVMLKDFQFNLLPIDHWYAAVDESPSLDWFSVELGIEVDGQAISLLPILLQLIRQSPKLLDPDYIAQRDDSDVVLVHVGKNGQRVALPYARIRAVLSTLSELYIREALTDENKLQLPRQEAARLSQLQTQGIEWHGGAGIQALAERLAEPLHSLVSAPAGLNATLRDYQQEGLTWLQNLMQIGMGGILADDMGLGKTLQTLAHILSEKNAQRLQQPALIIMPTSLIANWQDEAARFTPQLKVLTLHGPQRQRLFAEIAQADIVISTYALLSRDSQQLIAQDWHLLILDEAQTIKNPRSKAALCVNQLRAQQRLCLTGTPLENNLGELWSLFNFLMPGWLGDAKSFARHYRTPIEKHGNEQRLSHLKGRLKPFILRRTKLQVASELPAKTEITQHIDLSSAQRDRYETLRLAMDKKVRDEIQRVGVARSHIVVLEALLRLRQVCCDLRLLSEDDAQHYSSKDSAKIMHLLQMLRTLTAEGHRILVFSQFTSMLALIADELNKAKIEFVQLTGQTIDRRTPVQRFQNEDVPVFLISLKAGGVGLNLTAADTVIHVDPWWNPATEAQASDRAYRIGQNKPVFIYKLIARGSVEEKIQHLQQYKAALANSILDGGSSVSASFDDATIDALLAPLER